MSLLSFIEHAGEHLFGPAAAPQPPGVQPATCSSDLDGAAGEAIARYIAAQRLTAQNLSVTFDGGSKTVTVRGIAPDQATKEKILLCCGNVHSVAKVDDQLTVAQDSKAYPPSTWYEVKSGDTLSRIAGTVYGEAGGYATILEANRPMLRDPDRLYPGQQLRIPPKAG
ncbi:MAG TPA: peptidoglycan-binding protein LysM [Steroidobacteraceae bacterium]|nr:peptidoglycan-binding protein LysM [Steroidobacteraceae bacterium]